MHKGEGGRERKKERERTAYTENATRVRTHVRYVRTQERQLRTLSTICQRLKDGCWFLATSLVALCTANASKKRQRNVAAREAAKASFSTSLSVSLSLLAARWCTFLFHVDRRYKSSRWDQKPACIRRRRCSGASCTRSRGQIVRCIISSLRMQHYGRYIWSARAVDVTRLLREMKI